ncbi:MAG TPA: TIGR02302 family protein, partial [Stellaceae bacterium]|nr:TIGR02302 family protein [Stellaceae bacterium]
MSDGDIERPGTPPAAGLRLHLAGLAIFWERLWPALWPAVGLVGLFLVLALADLFRLLPGWLHAALLVAFAGATLFVLGRAAWRIRPPGIAASRRRLERASGLTHRPLTALADNLASAGNDPAAAALWQAHLVRMAAATRRLRVGRPASALAVLDPFALRAVLTLVLLIAAIGAGEQWDARLWRAVTPNFNSGPPAPPPSLDIWLTPPDYTGLAPQFLQRDYQGGPIPVPTGSAVLAQVHGGRNPPLLKLDQAATDFSRIDAQNFKVSGTITEGHRLTVEQDGGALAAWPIAVVPDLPPTISFATPPQPTQRAALRLEYQASDDYGIESVKAVITRPGGPPDEKIELDLPLPGLHPKEAKAASFHDLTPHVWAGLPVEIRLRASDAPGQIGESEPFAMTLPERGFQNPIARAIIEQRRQLTLTPTERQAVSEILSDLSARPALFRNDTVVFMALRAASARLLLDKSDAVIGQVQQLLWDTALRVEDGQLSLAQRDLREIQRRLQDALARNAPDAEIEKLMSELQQAIDKYLQSLAENMQRMDPEQLKNMPPVDPSRMISRNDLQKMLDKARELSRTGAKDAARDMLSRLQEMLENLQAARPGQMQQGNNNSQSRQAMRQMQ